jgi:hypothetical protein
MVQSANLERNANVRSKTPAFGGLSGLTTAVATPYDIHATQGEAVSYHTNQE